MKVRVTVRKREDPKIVSMVAILELSPSKCGDAVEVVSRRRAEGEAKSIAKEASAR
jgi:hypothetical protein